MTDRFDSKPLVPIESWRAGEALRQSKLNQSVDALNELRRGLRPPRQVTHARGGGAAEPAVGAERLVFLYAVGYDRLICLTDPEDTRTQVYVAKPHQLRRTPWHVTGRPWIGTSLYTYAYSDENGYTRSATRVLAGVTEVQMIRPSYATGDPILIRKVSGAMMWRQDSNELEGVEWMDWQYPTAREWASVPGALP
jgi:hypothetical protein